MGVRKDGIGAVTIPEELIPGTGATNLGKAIDSPVGATDTGVLVLGVHSEESQKIAVAEEDYDHLHISELGGLFVEPEQHHHFDEFDATTGWTVLGNDTVNLATTTIHLTGTNALIFDKTDGDANTIFAGIQKTITTVDMGAMDLHDVVQTVCFLSSLSVVAYVFVRIGTDSSNYNEWRVADTDLTAGDFTVLGLSVGSASHTGATGNGVDWSAVSYLAVGVAFDNETDALTGIIFDQLGIFTGTHSSTSITSEVTSSVSSANVNLQKVGGSTTDKGAGNVSNGSQRVVLASNQNFIQSEDVAAGNGDAGIPMLVKRTATPADTSNQDGDYEVLQLDNGRLWVSAGGAVAHSTTNPTTNHPAIQGYEAIAHGTNPTAVDAAEVTKGYANRAGIPFVIGGHPNVVTTRANFTSAQTDAALLTVSAGTKIVVTRCSVTADNANTGDVQVRIGFATATTPTAIGVLLSHPGVAPGSGVVEGTGAGILGVGADNEDLRITSENPSASIDVVWSHYTIES